MTNGELRGLQDQIHTVLGDARLALRSWLHFLLVFIFLLQIELFSSWVFSSSCAWLSVSLQHSKPHPVARLPHRCCPYVCVCVCFMSLTHEHKMLINITYIFVSIECEPPQWLTWAPIRSARACMRSVNPARPVSTLLLVF